MEAVSYTDTDGADVLAELAEQMADHGIWFGVARAEGVIVDRRTLAEAMTAIGSDHYFDDVDTAVQAARRAIVH